MKKMVRKPEFWVIVAACVFVVAGSQITESANFWILIAFITFFGAFGRAALQEGDGDSRQAGGADQERA